MIQKKVCMLGAFAVGKTSLVARFVKSIYSDQYLTTVGVKVDKKSVRLDDQEITMIVWDLAGEDEFQKVKVSNLQGSHGYLLVADGTRASSLETARELQQRALEVIGPVPFILIVNKSDLTEQWEIDEGSLRPLIADGWEIIKSSAKAGSGVDEAFSRIATLISVK